MKRFLLFACSRYDKSGGMDDYDSSFDTLELCVKYVNECHHVYDGDNLHVFDKVTDVITYLDYEECEWLVGETYTLTDRNENAN